MVIPLKLTEVEKKFLIAPSKRGFNKREYYDRIANATKETLRRLTAFAGAEIEDNEPKKSENIQSYSIPLEEYKKILPRDELIALIDIIISGQKRTKNNRDLDPYGTEFAIDCIRKCLTKLKIEYAKAIQSQMTKEQNKRPGASRMIYVNDFERLAHDLSLRLHVILDEVKEASEKKEKQG